MPSAFIMSGRVPHGAGTNPSQPLKSLNARPSPPRSTSAKLKRRVRAYSIAIYAVAADVLTNVFDSLNSFLYCSLIKESELDWELAIRRNREALLRLVAVLFASAGITPGGAAVQTLSRPVRSAILALLRPAESALRRLILIAARDLIVKVRAKRAAPTGPIPKGKGGGERVPPFALFDPRKSFPELVKKRRFGRGSGPRISSFDDPWTPMDSPQKPDPDAAVNAATLCGRLQAFYAALNDIAGQARRLARVQAQRRAAGEVLKRTEPLRPGFPPGHRRQQTREIDEILADCDWMARNRPPSPDTS